jgi:hypothetical protein
MTLLVGFGYSDALKEEYQTYITETFKSTHMFIAVPFCNFTEATSHTALRFYGQNFVYLE